MYQTVAPDTGTVTNYYDLAGNLTQTVDEENSDTRFAYDSRNRRTSTSYAYGMTESYTTQVVYTLGRHTRDIDGEGCFVDYDHYNNGRLFTSDSYEPTQGSTHSVTTYYYDAQGNRKAVNDPLGYTTYYDYDLMNRNYPGSPAHLRHSRATPPPSLTPSSWLSDCPRASFADRSAWSCAVQGSIRTAA